MDIYHHVMQDVLEKYQQTVLELYLLKVSGESSDKALERRLEAELVSLNSILEDLGYAYESWDSDSFIN